MRRRQDICQTRQMSNKTFSSQQTGWYFKNQQLARLSGETELWPLSERSLMDSATQESRFNSFSSRNLSGRNACTCRMDIAYWFLEELDPFAVPHALALSTGWCLSRSVLWTAPSAPVMQRSESVCPKGKKDNLPGELVLTQINAIFLFLLLRGTDS